MCFEKSEKQEISWMQTSENITDRQSRDIKGKTNCFYHMGKHPNCGLYHELSFFLVSNALILFSFCFNDVQFFIQFSWAAFELILC